MAEKATYSHGHHASVVRSHSQRTAQNSAAFLLPHIQPTDRILDLGCGPGSITVGLAKLVPQGSVVGGDSVESVLDQARAFAVAEGVDNVTFRHMDGNALPFEDGEFDVCFCHQVLQHVGDPIAVLREMRRVTKKKITSSAARGGIVAARDADYRGFVWMPEIPELGLWSDIYRQSAEKNGAQPNAGRYLKRWAKNAGFSDNDIEFSWDIWNYTGQQAVDWGQTWKERTLHSGFAKSAEQYGLADQSLLDRISSAWDQFSKEEDAFIIIPHGQILCHVS